MNHKPFEVTAQDFEGEVLDSNLPVLIEFTAEWCAPCKMLKPIIHALADKYEGQLRVGMIDCDNNPSVVMQYGVMGMPTMLLFVDGKPVERMVGFQPQAKIEAKLRPHLVQENA